MKKLISLLLFISFCVACTKKPVACFKTDKTAYIAGETVQLTDCSENASKLEWTLPDGTTATNTSTTYKIPISQDAGVLSFTLTASSKNGKKSDQSSKTVSVMYATGNAVFWTSDPYTIDYPVQVSMFGTVNHITDIDSIAPDCGTFHCATFSNIKVGTYQFVATQQWSTLDSTITITKDACTKVRW